MKAIIGCVTIILSAGAAALAQNLAPNPGFESGPMKPDGWRADGRGWITNAGRSSARAVVIDGHGNDSGAWRTDPISLVSGGLYRFSFDVKRSPGTSGGTAFSGISRVNRDFSQTDEWKRQSFVFAAPHDVTHDYPRIGQWNVKGQVLFDNVELIPVQALHARASNLHEIGEGESVRGGVYRFSTHLGWSGANYNRTLLTNRASFNSDRWMLGRGSEVIYRVGIAGTRQRSAIVRVNVNYRTAGTLVVDVSGDGRTWQRVGAPIDRQTSSGKLDLPAALFPAEHIDVRLRTEGDANLQVNQLSYEAPLVEPLADVEGETRLIAVTQSTPELAAAVNSITVTNVGEWAIDLSLTNHAADRMVTASAGGDRIRESQARAFIRSGTGTNLIVHVRSSGPEAAVLRLQLNAVERGRGRQQLVFAAETELQLYFLSDPRPGYWISESNGLALWWCESGWKIGRSRPAPERPAGLPPERVSVMLARGEFEPAQVVLTPREDGELLSARVEPFQGPRGTGQVTVAIYEVAYVPVANPTDGTARRGPHPDPLPDLETPLRLQRGVNQPLWLTFRAASDAAPGDHRGELVLETTWGSVRVPLRPYVYDFAMPAETHLRSAFGLGTREINRYHKLTTQADKELVFDKYLQNFADHRISPYTFYDYASMDVRFSGSGTNKKAKVDFTRFDKAAEKWLARGRFSTFQLTLTGMGGGTFESRALGRLEGFEEGTPEHARLFRDYLGQVEQHLRSKGWLDKAFTYWFDEPDPKDYEFVVAGMTRLKAAAPGLKRMLTEQPEPALKGHVDIWCGLTPEWTPEKVRERRAAGEAVWWYICTAPKAPYVTEFIDHPGTELRLWPWQSWQYGVEGILVWASIYWNSTAAFTAPQLQDPWNDPMSYVSGYSFKTGHVGFWGNGDGRFLYPPRRDPNTATAPVLDGPVTSIRWENLRDGMEDYEYFWMLEQEVKRLRGSSRARSDIAEAEALLKVPAEISADLVRFTTDPRVMLSHRDRMARMIERLRKL